MPLTLSRGQISMIKLVRYDAACRALAEARNVDEVKDIRDKAVAIAAYARQCKNKDLEADAYEIRKRAERRLGEVMAAQPKATGGNFNKEKLRVSKKPVTLADAGIDKNLADRARKTAAMPDAEFERVIAEGREEVKKSVERAAEAKTARKEKHRNIRARAISTPELLGPFPLIYADPPWKWGHFGERDKENEEGKGRTPDQHYETLSHEQLISFAIEGKLIREIAHRDAALLLWCTSSNLPRALDVMEAWGFEFKSSSTWVKFKDGKIQRGMGLVFRNAHEILLYGTRGNMPGPQYQPPSVFLYPRARHSEKPPEIRKEIEKMYPDFDAKTRLELFARDRVKGWTPFGFEVPMAEAAE